MMMDGSINPQGGRLETPLIIGKLFDVCSVVYIRLTVVLLFSFIASYTGEELVGCVIAILGCQWLILIG